MVQRIGAVTFACLCACGSHDAPPDARPAKPIVKVEPPKLDVPGVHLPDGVTPKSYDLKLQLDPDRDDFSGTVAIRVTLDRPTDHVWLHADELNITSAKWDDGTLDVSKAGDRMILAKLGKQVARRDITLTFAFTGTTHHDEEGLFRQKDGDRWYLYSQGESEYMRRITPCFDEPRWKTPWTIAVTAPKHLVVASNMPIAHRTAGTVTFTPTPPIPSYLVAVAVGPFAIVDGGTVGVNKVPLRTLTFPRRVKAVGPVVRQTGKLVAMLEDYTGIPLPFPKLDIVTVPHLFGAMENPGLITFDSNIVFDGDRRYAVIAAHELAHQWFGNLVTPPWWDDLWLSEAFASWLGEKVAAKNEGHPPSELHVAFTREAALSADTDAEPRALHRMVTFDPDNAFDSIAYDKGEAVLAMFEAWIGEDKFRAALRAYLHDHASGSVTTADLVKAVAVVSPEGAKALGEYVDHAGPPIVELSLACPKLTAHARDHLHIPVCVRADKTKVCALVGESTELPLDACPSTVVASGGGYYNVVWTTNGPLGPLPKWGQLSVGDKLAIAIDLAAATERGDLGPDAALAQITQLAKSPDPYSQYAAFAIAQALDPLAVSREPWSRWLVVRFPSVTMHGALGEKIRGGLLDMVTPSLLPASTRAASQQAVAHSLAKNLAPWDASAVLAAEPSHQVFERLAAMARDPKLDPDQREAAMVDLSAFGVDEIPHAVTELSALLPAHDAWNVVGPYFDRAATRDAAWAAIRDRLGELVAKMSNAQAGELIDSVATLCNSTERAEVAARFASLLGRILDGRARLDHALAAIDRCIARRAKAGDFAAGLR